MYVKDVIISAAAAAATTQTTDTGEAYNNFINSLKSTPTKKQYSKILSMVMNNLGITNLDDLVSLPMKEIEKILINYITKMNARKLSHSYINLVVSVMFHLFEMNDVVLNKRKIKKFIGEYRKMNKDRAYTHEEIKKLVDTGDFRLKAVILLLASSGIRIGAMNLSVRHLEPRGKDNNDNEIYKVTLYENTKEEYYSFTTPEAKKAIDEYLDYRKRCGEKITPNSPLFRTDFRMNDIQKIRKEAKAVSLETFKSIIHSRLVKLGLIEIPFENKTKRDPSRRNPVPLAHGFRKFWMKQAVNAKLNPEIREMLLGHSIGLAGAYYKPTEDEMLEEFMKAVDNLTIDPANRLQRKVEKLEVEKSQFDRLAAQIKALEAKIK